MPVTRESPVTRTQHAITCLITFNQFLPHFREIVCQHDRPHYGAGPEAEAGAAYLIPVAQVTYVPHVPQGVARAVTHRQEQVTVERWYPHTCNVQCPRRNPSSRAGNRRTLVSSYLQRAMPPDRL